MAVNVVFQITPDDGAIDGIPLTLDDMDLIALSDIRELIVQNPHLTVVEQISLVQARWGIKSRYDAAHMVMCFYKGTHLWTLVNKEV